ncbi:MAG: LuxR C-terminal-related transcriptional regulator [Solirubrobacteraceae bacterium]
MTLASHGCSYGEIAEQLVLATATVKTHLRHCYRKLGVPDKAAAVAAALRHGLIE